ncbi:MerR family transcriptional regulator [Streptosporangium sp. CA-115845]|uniref:MerR family transcriptional regulator n=1 Tax=Streptosporangium sp. CA-115845 TaxID=3240071 RepID=UPI003D89DF66
MRRKAQTTTTEPIRFAYRVCIGSSAGRAPSMTRDTIRFYEKVGLVAGRRLANGYRDFPPETVAWLHYVRTAQTLGFSLAEIHSRFPAVSVMARKSRPCVLCLPE